MPALLRHFGIEARTAPVVKLAEIVPEIGGIVFTDTFGHLNAPCIDVSEQHQRIAAARKLHDKAKCAKAVGTFFHHITDNDEQIVCTESRRIQYTAQMVGMPVNIAGNKDALSFFVRMGQNFGV